MSNTASKLREVRFYTALDPYYYTVDNRPLQDLNENMAVICNTIDLIEGGSDRAVYSAATIAATSVGEEVFVGEFEYTGGLVLNVLNGYMVTNSIFNVDNQSFKVPTIALHDTPTRFLNIAASTTPGRKVKYLIQGSMDEANETSHIPTSKSLARVAKLSLKKSAEYIDTSTEPTLTPDAGCISLASFVLSYGQTAITAADIKKIAWVLPSDLRAINTAGPVTLSSARINKVQHAVTLAKGASKVTLAGSSIDLSLGAGSIDVFVTGVYQTSFNINTSDNSITLGGTMPQAGEVNVVQRKIS